MKNIVTVAYPEKGSEQNEKAHRFAKQPLRIWNINQLIGWIIQVIVIHTQDSAVQSDTTLSLRQSPGVTACACRKMDHAHCNAS
jgi:hypothetical protein